MIHAIDFLRDLSFLTVMLHLGLSLLIGAAIGLERSVRNHPAGLRTHILVCLASNIASMSGLYLLLVMRLPTDISRISAQVISGLGFIGAGTIIVTRKFTIKGLTTAAGLWATGIIGLAIGAGYYDLAVMACVLVLITETVFAALSRHIRRMPDYRLEILYDDKERLDDVLRYSKSQRMQINNLSIHTLEKADQSRYSAIVHLHGPVAAEVLEEHIRGMAGIKSVSEVG